MVRFVFAQNQRKTNHLHIKFATYLHENVPLSETVHHLSGPYTYVLTRGAVCEFSVILVCVRCVLVCVVGVCGYVCGRVCW